MKRRGFLLLEGLLALALSACLAAAVFPGAAHLAGAAAHTEERLRADEESLAAVLLSQTASAGLWPAQTLRTAGAREIGIRFLPFRRAEKRKNILLPRRAASGS